MSADPSSAASPDPSTGHSLARIRPLPAAPACFKPDLFERAWCSIPHPTLPLLATAHARSVTIYSLTTFSAHSSLTGGHSRSVRSVAWKPGLASGKDEGDGGGNSSSSSLCLVTGSFDSTAGLWRWAGGEGDPLAHGLERDMTTVKRGSGAEDQAEAEDEDEVGDWAFSVVLDGHESEIKCATFSPSGIYLATCSRDKSVWIWEDVGPSEGDDEWETVAVLNEHEGDVKAVAWCPDVPGRTNGRSRRFGADALASASYDNTVRVWREDSDGDWVCVAVLEGHGQTVWGVGWEGHPRPGDRFPRLVTFSADSTVRIWSLEEADGDDTNGDKGREPEEGAGGLAAVPNSMRRSLREEWTCTAVLPAVHTGDVYSVAWSASTGLLASTGSDGVVAIYREERQRQPDEQDGGAAAKTDRPREAADAAIGGDAAAETTPGSAGWTVLAKMEAAHGPYEVNHITWCRRYDGACENKGVEEMLVTTGDDGQVRGWLVES